MPRARFTARSKSIRPVSTSASAVPRASESDWVNAVAAPGSGKPSARQSRRAWSRETPWLGRDLLGAVAAARRRGSLARARSRGGAPSRARAGRPGARPGPAPGAAPQAPSSRVGRVQVVEQLVEAALGLLDARDVGQRDLAVGAGVGDHQRAAAQQPVDETQLVGDVADPAQRDVVAAAGDDPVAGDQAPVGDRVRRGEPGQRWAHDVPEDGERDHGPHHQRDGAAGPDLRQRAERRAAPPARAADRAAP